MKIGMILDEVFPPDPRVENEAITLINSGFEVFLFCLKYADEKDAEIINQIQVKRFLSNKLEYKLSALAYSVPLYSFLMKNKIHQFIKETRIQIIHIHDIRIADAVFKANKKFNLPIVLDLHENRPEIMKYYPHLSKFPGKFLIKPNLWKRKEEEFIAKANKIIVVTEESKNEILSRLNIPQDKIYILPNTVRKSFFENVGISPSIKNSYKNNFILLYIGDTGLRRGLKTAIKSISNLKNEIPNVKLLIVGKNSSDFILKKLVHDLNIDEYVDFLGWKDQSLFGSYISISNICLSPLHRNLHHDTTYANKLFQYMSLGKPLLVSNATAQQNLILNHKTGLVHEEENVDDFTVKVLELYHNKVLRDTLGENGQNFVRNTFSWEKRSKELINLYKSLDI